MGRRWLTRATAIAAASAAAVAVAAGGLFGTRTVPQSGDQAANNNPDQPASAARDQPPTGLPLVSPGSLPYDTRLLPGPLPYDAFLVLPETEAHPEITVPMTGVLKHVPDVRAWTTTGQLLQAITDAAAPLMQSISFADAAAPLNLELSATTLAEFGRIVLIDRVTGARFVEVPLARVLARLAENPLRHWDPLTIDQVIRATIDIPLDLPGPTATPLTRSHWPRPATQLPATPNLVGYPDQVGVTPSEAAQDAYVRQQIRDQIDSIFDRDRTVSAPEQAQSDFAQAAAEHKDNPFAILGASALAAALVEILVKSLLEKLVESVGEALGDYAKKIRARLTGRAGVKPEAGSDPPDDAASDAAVAADVETSARPTLDLEPPPTTNQIPTLKRAGQTIAAVKADLTAHLAEDLRHDGYPVDSQPLVQAAMRDACEILQKVLAAV